MSPVAARELPMRGPLVIGSQVVGASWHQGNVALEHRRWVCAEEKFPASRSTHARITLTETGRTERTVVRIEGRVAYDGADRPGAISYVPAGIEREYSYRGADLTYTGLWVEADHAQALVGGGSSGAPPYSTDETPLCDCCSPNSKPISGRG